MNRKTCTQHGLLGAGIVSLLAGSALGFEGQRGGAGPLGDLIDTFEAHTASNFHEIDSLGSLDPLSGGSFALTGMVPTEAFDVLLHTALSMPGMLGTSAGLSVARAIERQGFEQAKRARESKEKVREYTERSYHLDSMPRNYRGQRIDYAAPVRYVESFEDYARGQEWTISSKLTDGDMYTRFLGPVRNGEQVLYVRVDPGEAYTLKFDLYLIGVPRKEYDPKAEIRVVVDGVPLATLGYGELRRINTWLNGNNPDFDPDIARGLLVPFIADSGVVEICFCGGSEMVLSPGSWGLDNVVVDRTPTNPGAVGSGGGTPLSSGNGGMPGGGGGAARSYPQSNPFERGTPFKGSGGSGGGGGSSRPPFDFPDFFEPPEPEEPPLDDPPEEDPPFDPPEPPLPPDTPNPPDDPPVPSPGTLFLGPLLALGAMRRRRR